VAAAATLQKPSNISKMAPFFRFTPEFTAHGEYRISP
jgi:hypothetical protein